MPPVIMREERAVVLLSGGIDSAGCVAWAKANRYVTTGLFFHYGQPQAAREELAARAVCQRAGATFRRVDLPPLPHQAGEYVARNPLFVLLAAALYGGFRKIVVVLGTEETGSRAYADATPESFDAVNELVRVTTYGRVRVACPLLVRVRKYGAKLAKQAGLADVTFGCEKVDVTGEPCGTCHKCVSYATLQLKQPRVEAVHHGDKSMSYEIMKNPGGGGGGKKKGKGKGKGKGKAAPAAKKGKKKPPPRVAAPAKKGKAAPAKKGKAAKGKKGKKGKKK